MRCREMLTNYRNRVWLNASAIIAGLTCYEETCVCIYVLENCHHALASMRPLIAPASSYKILRNFSHDPCISHMATQIERAFSFVVTLIPFVILSRSPLVQSFATLQLWDSSSVKRWKWKFTWRDRVQIGNKIGMAERDMAKKGCQFSLPPFLSRTDARGRRFLFTRPRKVAH